MKNIKLKITYLLSVVLFMIYSCESTDLDLRENPNGASPQDANVALLLNGAMKNFIDYNEELTNFGMQVTRMTHMYGPVYDNAYTPQSFNNLYSNAYSGVMADTRAVIKNGTTKELYEHVAVAKILESYTLSTLVDMFGDVPYSEAISYSKNLNPKVDDDKELYEIAITLLDEAINDFNKSSVQKLTGADDIFYKGKKDKWIKLAKTLKLRLYNNSRLVNSYQNEINSLITNEELITTSNDDFQIEYGTKDNDPDIRHFKFKESYLGNSEYLATYFMNLLYKGKTNVDPRMRYYFYRQSLVYPDATTNEGLFTMPCLGETKPTHYSFSDPFCNIGDGYWGRDHGNNDGGPPDDNKITVWGLYPAGGKYDNNQGTSASKSDGAKGEGILPIWTNANTYFLLAESSLMSGTSGDTKEYLKKGIEASLKKVTTFRSEAIPSSANTPSSADLESYVNEVLTNFENASSQDAKLNIIITEAYISNWGNGIEVYNNYRRTSKPDNLQPTISATPGTFIRSFPYPSNLVDRNSNVNAKSGNNVRVFWDENPDNLN